MGIFEFPKDIKYLIFGYCFDFEYDNIFDMLTCVYLVKLFKFDNRLIPLLINVNMDENIIEELIFTDSRFSEFKPFIINTSYSCINVPKKKCSVIQIITDRYFNEKLLETGETEKTKLMYPELLNLVNPNKKTFSVFADLIKNSQNISVIFPNNLDFLGDLKKLHYLLIRENKNIPLEKMDVNTLEFGNFIEEEELKKIVKKFGNLKSLCFSNNSSTLKYPLSEILPESILKLKISSENPAFTDSGEPVYKDLKISELSINGYINFNFELTGKNPVFPKNLTHLEVGSIPSLMTKENRRILPNRKLRFLKICITEETKKLSFKKNGKRYSALPDVETLILNLLFYGGIKTRNKLIIPGSVSNLELIGISDLYFEKIGITFEKPENLRSLVVSVCDKFTDTDLDKILSIGKLESLIIQKTNEFPDPPIEKIVIKIPDSLRILISEIPVKLIGSFKNMIYIDIGE